MPEQPDQSWLTKYLFPLGEMYRRKLDPQTYLDFFQALGSLPQRAIEAAQQGVQGGELDVGPSMETALNLMGTSMPFAKPGTLGVGGGKPPSKNKMPVKGMHDETEKALKMIQEALNMPVKQDVSLSAAPHTPKKFGEGEFGTSVYKPEPVQKQFDKGWWLMDDGNSVSPQAMWAELASTKDYNSFWAKLNALPDSEMTALTDFGIKTFGKGYPTPPKFQATPGSWADFNTISQALGPKAIEPHGSDLWARLNMTKTDAEYYQTLGKMKPEHLDILQEYGKNAYNKLMPDPPSLQTKSWATPESAIFDIKMEPFGPRGDHLIKYGDKTIGEVTRIGDKFIYENTSGTGSGGTIEFPSLEMAKAQAQYDLFMALSAPGPKVSKPSVPPISWTSLPETPPSSAYKPYRTFQEEAEHKLNKYLEPVDWSTYQPPPMVPKAPELSALMLPARAGQAEDLGFNLGMPLYKGGSKPYYRQMPDPMRNSFEQGIFFADNPGIAEQYGQGYNLPHFARAERAAKVDWTKATGQAGYDSGDMTALINTARKQGYDMLIVENMRDVGGRQSQYIPLKEELIRAPHAEFDPKKLKMKDIFAGLGGAAAIPTTMQELVESLRDK